MGHSFDLDLLYNAYPSNVTVGIESSFLLVLCRDNVLGVDYVHSDLSALVEAVLE
jgi:hypothetical protein